MRSGPPILQQHRQEYRRIICRDSRRVETRVSRPVRFATAANSMQQDTKEVYMITASSTLVRLANDQLQDQGFFSSSIGSSNDGSTFYGDSPNNSTTLSFLVPSVVSILWFHDSAAVVKILLVRDVDLRHALGRQFEGRIAVGVWIVAFLLTVKWIRDVVTGVGDTDFDGWCHDRCMAQLAVRGYCSWVRLRCHVRLRARGRQNRAVATTIFQSQR